MNELIINVSGKTIGGGQGTDLNKMSYPRKVSYLSSELSSLNNELFSYQMINNELEYNIRNVKQFVTEENENYNILVLLPSLGGDSKPIYLLEATVVYKIAIANDYDTTPNENTENPNIPSPIIQRETYTGNKGTIVVKINRALIAKDHNEEEESSISFLNYLAFDMMADPTDFTTQNKFQKLTINGDSMLQSDFHNLYIDENSMGLFSFTDLKIDDVVADEEDLIFNKNIIDLNS